MKLFIVVFYSLKDGDQDIAWLVAANEVAEAADIAEAEFNLTSSKVFQSFSAYGFNVGISPSDEAGVVTGPFYGKMFNKKLCDAWIREQPQQEWNLFE